MSLLGLATCGLLSPVGLLFSFLALSKRPRGAASAGFVLGLLGSAWVAFVGAVAVSGALKAAAREEARQIAQTRSVLADAHRVIEGYRSEHGRLPEGIEGNKLVLTLRDTWNTPLRFDLYDDDFAIRSAGQDTEFDTADDVVFPRVPPTSARGPKRRLAEDAP